MAKSPSEHVPEDGIVHYTISMVCDDCKGKHFVVRAALDGHVGAHCPMCGWHYEIYCPDLGLLFDPGAEMEDAEKADRKTIKS